MAGGGSSELRRVAAEMVQVAAWVRVLRDEQRDLAARLAKLEGQLDAKAAEASPREAEAVPRDSGGRSPRSTGDAAPPNSGGTQAAKRSGRVK